MADFDETYRQNHRHQQFLVLGVALLGLCLSIVPRQERALFITQGTGIKAFGVNLPLPPFNLATFLYPPQDLVDDFLPRAFFARTPRPGAPGGRPEAPGADLVPGGGNAAPFTPADAAPDAVGGVPDTLTPATPGGGGGGSPFPFTPPFLGGTPASPGAPRIPPAPPGTTPGAPGTTPGTPGTSTDTPVPTVPAVPEPAAWVMMLTGFLGVGAALRRRGMRPIGIA